MTAVVGILNKTAIAIAADSAVTISGENGNKIFNTANKIFKLSKYHPVGIAIYNSANLLLTPWEIIIKLYREQLKDNSFPTVKDYKDDFIKYLKENKIYYSSSKQAQKSAFKGIILRFIIEFTDNFESDSMLNEDENWNKLIDEFNIFLEKYINEKQHESNKNIGLNELSDEDLNQFTELSNFEDIFKDYDLDDEELKNNIIKAARLYYRSIDYKGQWSGMIFAGYGNDEIYPTTISIKVGEVIADHIRITNDRQCIISDKNPGGIMPFAQRDVIDTVIQDISPAIDSIYTKSLTKFLEDYNARIIQELTGISPELDSVADKLKKVSVSNLIDTLKTKLKQDIYENSVKPTIKTIQFLSREDLGEMAESLIYMTYLKRRIMSDEESVGGPVDVAIISKTDGFVWIKRKYYFKSELNPHFFHTYFKNTE